MSHMLANHAFRRLHALPFRTLDGETVIVNPRQREVHVLNGTASRIWEALADWHTLPEVVTILADEEGFDVPSAVVEEDVLQFLDEMMDKGLITDGELALMTAAAAG